MGASIPVKKDSMKELVDGIVEQITQGMNMGLFIDSDIAVVDEAGKETVLLTSFASIKSRKISPQVIRIAKTVVRRDTAWFNSG
jgi:hypothetical protein